MKTNILANIRFGALTMVCLMVFGVGNAWGDETLTITGSIIGGSTGYSSSSATATTDNDSDVDVEWTDALENSTPLQLKASTGVFLSTSCPSGFKIKSIKITSVTNTMNLYCSSDGSSWSSSLSYTDGTALDVASSNYKYFKVTATTKYTKANSIVVVYTASTPQTVTFDKQGGTFDDPSVFTNTNQITEASGGAGITLPLVNPSAACAAEGWGFYGWKASSAVTSETTTAPTIVGKAGDTYYPAGATTLYAVFAKGEYTKITSSGDLESDKKYIIAIESSGGDYYVVTDSYSYSSVGEIKCKQISETSSNKYSAAAINANWRYSIEGSGTYYIRDVVSSSSKNYVDLAFVDFYGSTEDDGDMYTFTFDEDGYCLIENDYAYAYFDETNYTFTRNNSDASYFFLYKETSTPYYNSNPSCCDKEVSVSESGSSHITSMAFSESSVATCGDAASRTITITVTPASGYSLFGTTKPVFTKTSGTVAATIGSVTDNGDGTFSYECTFNSNDNGAGTFAISPGQFTNYRTLCCTKYDITLADGGAPTGGLFAVTDGDKDITEACGSTALELEAVAEDGYEFSTWIITKTSNGADAWDDVEDTGSATDEEIIITMPNYAITVSAAFTCTEPSISVQPKGGSYTQGESAAALSVTASAGTGTVDYQWQSSSDNSSWDNIDDETSASYTPSTASIGTTYYRVVVTNHECSESVESDAATIVVSAPSVCKTPTFSVSAGTYSSAQSVVLTCGTDGATIRYTTDGNDPTESSSVYSSPISVSVNMTIKAKAFKADMTPSSVATATYNIRCAAPTFNLAEDSYYIGSQSLTMCSATDGATIRYTTDESEPTGSSSVYSSALTVLTTTTYKAKAFKAGMTESEESEVYIMIQCAAPTFSVSAGTYNANQSVSISTTYGTTIYYTLDGNDPTTMSSTYSSAITIDATKTLKAIAVTNGCENSEVASATYTMKCATPTFSPTAGTYTGIQSVALSCATDGATIHYTTNGDDPTGSSDTYSSALSVGSNQTVQAIATKSGWSDSEIASAAYTIRYTIAVASVENVTISATTPSVAEGGNALVNNGSTVTLSYTGVAEGKNWGGWNVYKTGDASTKVFVTNNQFTMPDYNVTVSAYLYGDAIAWCDPDVEVTGDVHLTSTKDVYVHSTSAADNLIAVASTELGSATSIEVGYLDGSDDEVDKASSPFRLYASDASATVDEVDVSASRTFSSTNYSIRYTPSAYGVTNNYKLQLKLKKGDKVLKTITHAIYGRGLPEEFVIAVKKDAQWYALPNTILNNTSAVKPTKIRVDNETTPTAATYTANTTVYKATGRNTEGSNIYGIRFTDPDGHWLQVSSTAGTNYVWTSTTNSDAQQVWMLQTTNFGAYTMTLPTSGAGDKSFGINNLGNMGFHASDATNLCKEVYLLPITNTYTEIAATVSEWGAHGVVVQPTTPSDLSSVTSATMNVGTADPEAATTTAINAAYGTAKRVKVDDNDGDLDIGVIENEGKSLFIHWKNGSGTEIGVSQVTIPTVIATSADMYSIATTKAAWAAKSEVYVLPGATLTANAGSFSGEGALSVSNLHLYPGATLNVSTGTFNASTLRLHNGWTRAGTKKYDVARVYIADDAALTKTTASMDYDIYESSEGRHFYPLAVPFPVAVSDINYADSWLAGYANYGMSGQYVIKEYNGERRAEKGPDQVNNWTPIASDATLSPGKGYIMTAIPVYGEAIIRVPLTFNNAWTADGEKATVSDVTKNVVAVTAYSGTAAGDKKVNKGWNLLGVPFMSCYTTSAGMYADEGSATVIQGKFNFEDGTWDSEDKVRYVNVPVHDFSEYVQTDITDDDTKLLPGWCFFVQIETSGNLKFLTAQQAQNSSLPIYAPKLEDSPVVKTGIILSDGEKSDKTTFLISDKYSAEYEIGEDLEKMFGSAFTLSTYSMMNNTKLAYNALSPDEAKLAIPVGVRIPEDGEYTFSLNPRYEEANIERLDLIDYETSQITNLMTDSYTFTMTQGENTERFALNVTMRKETPTGLENGVNDANDANGANRVRKLIINEKLYILRDGMIFDATGKRVSEINK